MSPGGIAFTALLILGAHDTAILGVVAWLMHHRRIVLAATPKPQAQQRPKQEAAAIVEDLAKRRTG